MAAVCEVTDETSEVAGRVPCSRGVSPLAGERSDTEVVREQRPGLGDGGQIGWVVDIEDQPIETGIEQLLNLLHRMYKVVVQMMYLQNFVLQYCKLHQGVKFSRFQ